MIVMCGWEQIKTNGFMMRHNRISKLLLLLIIPSLLGLIFNWIQILCYSFAPLVSSIIVAICFRGRWMGLLLLWTFVASVAFNVPLQNWLFHSADDIVRYASITDLYKEKDKPMYFTFDRLEVDNKRRSTIGIWREHTRRVSRHSYRTEKKQHWYSVSPVFEDSLPEHKYAEREVKAWVVAVKHDKQDSLVCYEWCTFDIGDYKKAIDKSRCKVQHSDAPIIKPLYKQFTTKSEWRNIFLNVGLLVFSIQVLIGVIMNYRVGKS